MFSVRLHLINFALTLRSMGYEAGMLCSSKPVGRAGKALVPGGRSHAQGGKTGAKNGACIAADPEAIL